MDRLISGFRLLPSGTRTVNGPLEPSADDDVCPEAVAEFLDSVYIATEKLRSFGLSDKDFGGPIKLVARKGDEKANGRYTPGSDSTVIFHPPVRSAPDVLWVIVHETLHRIWAKQLTKESHEIWGLICNSIGKPIDGDMADALTRTVKTNPDRSSLWFFFKKHFGDDLGVFRNWLTTKKMSDSFPSDYSNSNPSEAFAEVGTDIILGRGRAGREIRRSGSMVKKVFLSLVQDLRHKEMCEDIALVRHAPYPEENRPDPNFLQLQVDFYYLRWKLGEWVRKRLSGNDVLKLEERPHATLYYGADRRDLPQIQKIIGGHGRSLRMMLGSLNVFEHEDKDVLYFELIGDPLPTLHEQIKKLPNTRPPTHPEYVPHLTVAYMKKGSARKFIGTSPLRMIISARRVTVIDSVGIESMIRTSQAEELVREPLLLAGP